MNERKRVSLSIFSFVVVALGFVVMGIYGFQRMGTEAHAAGADMSPSALKVVSPESVGLDSRRLEVVDEVVNNYMAEGAFPGAVVGIVRDGKMVYRKSFGYRQVKGDSVPMTLDTRFDLASLTKPVAVATSVMQLVERGKLSFGDRVDKYIPGFRGWAEAKEDGSTPAAKDTVHIRVVDLLTHTSGLPPYVSLKSLQTKYPDAAFPNRDLVLDYIASCDRWAVARTERIYSCLNYITLAHIVEIVAGEPINEYAEANIFEPLGMKSTGYLPSADVVVECAPTELTKDGVLYQGVVHDPLAREGMGCVSGNAGLFSTLDDLSVFVAMLLNNGSWGDADILSPRGVNAIFSRPLGYEKWDRTVGWENFSSYPQTGGDLFSSRTIGHTGATGTSIVIDPELKIAVIVLTNYVHSTKKSSLLEFRSRISSVVAASVRW